MIIKDEENPIISSETLSENMFQISNNSVIFDILRKKMYSDPIRGICREISANAKDANVEAGRGDRDIEISLPNAFKPFLTIKDCGPGISPERMADVFVKYGASTKRDSNTQIGAFGLGAKIPFAYSDSFTITTIHNGIKYHYAAFIDETRCGKISLLDQEETTEESGTEIGIPIKASDFSAFRTALADTIKFWDKKPKVLPEIPSETNFLIKKDKWALVKDTDNANNFYAIISGFSYKIDVRALNLPAYESNIIGALSTYNKNTIMYFDLGEITISANRESIFLDDKTKNKIKERISLIGKEILPCIQEKIDQSVNTFEAIKNYQSTIDSYINAYYLRNVMNLNFTYKDRSITSLMQTFQTLNVTKYSKSVRYSRKHLNNSSKTVNKCVDLIGLQYSDKTKLLFKNFEGEYKKDKIHELLETYDSVQVIYSPEGLNITFDPSTYYDNKDLDLLEPEELSDYAEPKTAKSIASINKVILYKFSYDDNKWSQISQKEFKTLPKDKLIYIQLDSDKKTVYPIIFNHLTVGNLRTLFPECILVGSKNRPNDKLMDGVSNLDIVKTELLKDKDKYIKIRKDQIDKGYFNSGRNNLISSYLFQCLIGRKEKIKGTDLYNFLNIVEEKESISREDVAKCHIYFLVFPDQAPEDKPSEEIIEQHIKISEKYPMLKFVKNSIYDPTDFKHIFDYVNSIEGKNEKN